MNDDCPAVLGFPGAGEPMWHCDLDAGHEGEHQRSGTWCGPDFWREHPYTVRWVDPVVSDEP